MELNQSDNWSTIQTLIQKDGMVHVPNFGAQLSIASPQDLSEVLSDWPIEWRTYRFGQSRRSKLAGQVYTASEYSPSSSFPTHHELSYTPNPPRWIVFYAHRGADSGRMRLLDGRLVFEHWQKSMWSDLIHQDVLYRKCMPSEKRLGFGKTWQEHFEDSDRDSVVAFLDSNGISYRWLDNGDLSIQYRTSLTREHSVGRVWYAQPRLWDLPFRGMNWFQNSVPCQHWPTAVKLGNDSTFPRPFLNWLEDQEQYATKIQLEDGGLLIIDNHRVAHGREPFVGQREHWVTMGS